MGHLICGHRMGTTVVPAMVGRITTGDFRDLTGIRFQLHVTMFCDYAALDHADLWTLLEECRRNTLTVKRPRCFSVQPRSYRVLVNWRGCGSQQRVN